MCQKDMRCEERIIDTRNSQWTSLSMRQRERERDRRGSPTRDRGSQKIGVHGICFDLTKTITRIVLDTHTRVSETEYFLIYIHIKLWGQEEKGTFILIICYTRAK